MTYVHLCTIRTLLKKEKKKSRTTHSKVRTRTANVTRVFIFTSLTSVYLYLEGKDHPLQWIYYPTNFQKERRPQTPPSLSFRLKCKEKIGFFCYWFRDTSFDHYVIFINKKVQPLECLSPILYHTSRVSTKNLAVVAVVNPWLIFTFKNPV